MLLVQLFVALLAILPGAAAAEVVSVSDPAVSARPGDVVTAVFRVSGAEGALSESLALPPGWSAATPFGRLEVPGGRPRARIVAFQVSPDAPAGPQVVTYTAGDAQAALRVDVARVEGLAIEVIAQPEYVLAGEGAAVRLRVTNLGNAAERVTLDVAPEPMLRAALSAGRVDLAPRASTEVDVDIGTRREEDRPTQRIVRVSAAAPGARAETVVILPIMPRGGRADTVRRYPVRASVVATTDGRAVAVQPVAEGHGALDASGAWTLDLRLRGPDARGTGAFAERDEYRAKLTTPFGHLGVGDHVYALSPLTTPGRYGRGVSGELSMGPVYAGAWYAMDRLADLGDGPLGVATTTGTFGASAGARLGEGGLLGLQLLRREGDDPTLLTSLLAEVPVSGDTRVEAEVAMDNTRTRPALASRAELLARLPGGLSLALRELAASPNYAGHEQDVHRTQGTLVVPLGRRLAARAGLAREERNLGRSVSVGEAPLAWRGDAQLVWSAPAAWSIEGGVAGASRVDLLGEDAEEEGAVRLQIARGAPGLYLSLLGLGGAHRDRETGTASLATQVAGYAMWSPTAALSLRGRASWGSRGEEATSLFAAESAVGLGGTFRPAGGFQADVDVSRRFLADAASDHVDARAQYTFAGVAAVAARYRLDRAPLPEHSGLLSVSLPVGAPVGRRTDVGRVEGRVYDADRPGNPGLPGVLLRVSGQVARTGPDGAFRFARLPAGTHRLEVDRGTLGLDRVTLDEMPLVLRVPGGGTATADIGVTTAATLRGRVVLVGFSPTDDEQGVVLGDGTATETRPAVGVGVVVRLGEERHTRITDGDGAFALDGLRPGAWEVELPASQVPTWYRVERPRQQVPLAAGGTGDVEIVVEPMVRMIHLFDSAPLEVRRAPDPEGPTGARAPAPRSRRPPPGVAPAATATGSRVELDTGWADVCEPEPDHAVDHHGDEDGRAPVLADDECDGRVEGVSNSRVHTPVMFEQSAHDAVCESDADGFTLPSGDSSLACAGCGAW